MSLVGHDLPVRGRQRTADNPPKAAERNCLLERQGSGRRKKRKKPTLAAVTLCNDTGPLRMSRAETKTFRTRHGG